MNKMSSRSLTAVLSRHSEIGIFVCRWYSSMTAAAICTGEILAGLAAEDPRIDIVTFTRNFGHQAAVSAGLRRAEGDVAAVIDADLQDPPEVVLEFIDRWLVGYDVVYGIRTKRKESPFKRLSYSVFYRIFQALASIDAPLDAGDFCLIDRRILDTVNALPEKNRFFRGLRAWAGSRQTGVAYARDPRAAGESKYPFLKLVKLASDGIFNFSTAPLTMVFYVGITMATVAFLGLGPVLVSRIFDIAYFGMRAGAVQGFASTILSILFIGGVQMVSTGILGEYIGRIYQEVKARPAYVIQSDVSRRAGAAEEAGSSARTDRPMSQHDSTEAAMAGGQSMSSSRLTTVSARDSANGGSTWRSR